VILATQLPEKKHQGLSMIHEVLRLNRDGELTPIARFEDALDAERLVETLYWERPGEYVIRHFLEVDNEVTRTDYRNDARDLA
jgi:hypothetical protein